MITGAPVLAWSPANIAGAPHHQPNHPPCQQPRYSLFVLLVIHGSFDKDCYFLFSNRGCKSNTDKNILAAANAWGNSRSDLSWDREALPDRRVSIGQNPKFRVWPMRPAREQHAVLVAGRVPDQIFVGESCLRHLLVREHDTNTKIKSTHPKASASNCYYKVMFFSASCFCTSGCAINSS